MYSNIYDKMFMIKLFMMKLFVRKAANQIKLLVM